MIIIQIKAENRNGEKVLDRLHKNEMVGIQGRAANKLNKLYGVTEYYEPGLYEKTICLEQDRHNKIRERAKWAQIEQEVISDIRARLLLYGAKQDDYFITVSYK